jgi:hypothetical protein
MEPDRNSDRAIVRLIFAASLASLSYELALMRIFSISLWYHFAFMVISIAMLGIAASGTALSLFPSLKNIRRIPLYSFLLAAGMPASYLLANAVPFDPARLSWDWTQLFDLSLYYLMLSVPFFCFGLIVSAAYSAMPRATNAIYASDLAGAGGGAIAMVWLLSLGGPEMTVFTLSTLLLTGLLHRTRWRLRALALLLIAVNMTILFLHPAFIKPRISPYKPFALFLQFPGAKLLGTAYSPYARVDLFTSPAVRFAPGLSFTYLDPLPNQTGLAIDAGEIHAMTDETDPDRLAFIGSLPSSLAYRLAHNQDILIIEPRTGLSVLTARRYGAKNVLAIDSNPLVLDVVRTYGGEHGSRLYEENTLAGLARTRLSGSTKEFDLIDLSIMGSLPSASFGFAEDYRFTSEAFMQYLTHLKPDGIISLTCYIVPPPRTELRLLTTLARAAEAAGISDFSRHVAAIRSWDTLTLLVKRSVLTAADIRAIRTFAAGKRFDLVYVPGIRPGESNRYIKMADNDYALAFKRLISRETRGRFMTDYLFDIRPVSDEKPFFHYYLKLENLQKTYRLMGKKWQFFIEEGFLLPVLLLQVIIVSMVLILLPLLKSRRRETTQTGQNPLRALSYFALLGPAYLFVEIALIQKMILGLENPSFAASTVIASVLICSGIGSALSQRIRPLRNSRVLLVLAGVVIVSSLLLPTIIAFMGRFSLPLKIMLAFATVMPAGILMGIPFPFGISLLGASSPQLIPWAWAVNGCFSVLAPILAVMLALSMGYQFVLLTGAAAYVLAFWSIQRVRSTAESVERVRK